MSEERKAELLSVQEEHLNHAQGARRYACVRAEQKAIGPAQLHCLVQRWTLQRQPTVNACYTYRRPTLRKSAERPKEDISQLSQSLVTRISSFQRHPSCTVRRFGYEEYQERAKVPSVVVGTRTWLLRRNLHGPFHSLLKELQHEDAGFRDRVILWFTLSKKL